MKFKFTVSPVWVIACIGLAGCHSAPGEDAATVAIAGSEAAASPASSANQVIILKPEAPAESADPTEPGTLFNVVRQGSVRLPSGALEVYATFRSRSDTALQLECRLQFLGAERETVEGPTAWQRLAVPPHGLTTFKGLSQESAKAEYFVLEVREAR